MVLQKRLDYGFNGYQVPAMPRASRSARGRRSLGVKVEDKQMSAFELLATVAGNLLQERESSAPSNASVGNDQSITVKDTVKQEQHDEEKPLKVEPCDQGSCDESVFVSEIHSQVHNQNYTSKKFLYSQSDATLGLYSIITTSDQSEKVGCDEKLVRRLGRHKNTFGNLHSKVKGGSPGYGESCKDKVEDEIEKQLEAEPQKIGSVMNENVADTCCLEDPKELNRKPPALISSDSSVEVPLNRDHIPCGSFRGCQDDMKVVSRDDDENSSGCTQPSTIMKEFRKQPRIGDRRIRKLLASKYWKVAPKLKDDELSNTDGEMKPVYRNRKTCFTRQRSQRNFSFKRRKLYQSSVSTSDGGISSEGISTSPEKGINGDGTASDATMHGATGTSSSVAGQQASFQSMDSHVKLSIKSFRVPELFIDISETATVGSLKRAVMEAVTAILGGELHIGVLIQGKKVRDDNKTLLQTGISQDDRMDTLGFMLEPNPAQDPPPLCPENSSFLLHCDTPLPLTRYSVSPTLDPVTSDASPDPPVTNLGNCVQGHHDSVFFPTDISTVNSTPDSRALVAIPAMSVEALAVVPLHRKSRRSELVQRRIRRPFSVSEVEALVQAVEKLGTGRWRDVKLRSFDNAKHRTYVDLKDKWKTLVHTAKISPQQRRGEPVPQELLDRVLSAHAYWSQQAKQHVKQQSESCLLL
ncbi:hypothetical protein HHK36_019075 [Tetracentron sinense]|uniref:Uncharacterized protein n=1 Tax=Tetracentron sinense TaxID=13715 RepID=A0A835DCF9_TETSI|nr:hypothetical protein HHK36_019075 [Tetracentron sinense]